MLQRYMTKGLMSLGGVLIAIVVYGCVPQAVPNPEPVPKPEPAPKLEPATTPPEGAVTAELGFPPVGTTWVIKTVVHGTESSSTRTITSLGKRMHDGRPVYRTSRGALFDRATRNWTADVRRGRVLRSASPYIPTYAFPLWVGKSWQGTFTYTDHEQGDTYTNAVWRGRVTAYEEVTVPVGTFTTFKVEGGSAVSEVVHWYSPTPHIAVKSVWEQLPGNPYGAEKFTSELMEYSAPK